MEKVDRILNEHGVRYFIVAGTLLGAVRHQAIIPWDDDIDIGIMESDLEKFNAIDFESYGLKAKGVERNNIGKIFYLNRLDSGAKMKSVFIDIFVFEKKDDRYMYAYTYAQNSWPNEYFLAGTVTSDTSDTSGTNDQGVDELYPLKRYKFGNVWVNGPNKYLPYCERSWGANWQVPKFKSLKTLLYPIESFQRMFVKPKTPIIRDFNDSSTY